MPLPVRRKIGAARHVRPPAHTRSSSPQRRHRMPAPQNESALATLWYCRVPLAAVLSVGGLSLFGCRTVRIQTDTATDSLTSAAARSAQSFAPRTAADAVDPAPDATLQSMPRRALLSGSVRTGRKRFAPGSLPGNPWAISGNHFSGGAPALELPTRARPTAAALVGEQSSLRSLPNVRDTPATNPAPPDTRVVAVSSRTASFVAAAVRSDVPALFFAPLSLPQSSRRVSLSAASGAPSSFLQPLSYGATRLQPTSASTYGWQGSGTAWNSTANWSAGVVPTGVDIANFTTSGNSTPTLTANQSILGLNFAPGAKTYTFGGAYTLTIDASGITHSGSNGETISTSNIGLNTSQTWNVAGNTLTINAAIQGEPSTVLTKTGAAILSLTNQNPYLGPTIVNGGTLQLKRADGTFQRSDTVYYPNGPNNTVSYTQRSGSDVAINSGASVQVLATNGLFGAFNNDERPFGSVLNTNQTVTINAGGTLLAGTGVNFSNGVDLFNTTLAGGTLASVNTSGISFTVYSNRSLVVTANSTISAIGLNFASASNRVGQNTAPTVNVADGATLTVSGTIVDSPIYILTPFYKTGAGTMLLTGTNTYTTRTFVDDGILEANSTASLPGYNILNKIDVSGTLALAVGGSGQFSKGNVDTTIANLSTYGNGGHIGFDTTGGNFTYASAIGGGLGLTKLGTNTLILTGTNTNDGGTVLSGGTLNIGADVALGNISPSGTYNGEPANLSFKGGTLQYAAAFTLNSNRGIYLGAGGGTIDTNGYSVSIGGTIFGTGNLTKTGAGTLTLNNSASDYGSTTISGGALQFGDGTSSNGQVTGNIVNNAALIFANPNAQTYGGIISGGGSLTKTGSGTLTLTNTSALTGLTTISVGTLQLGDGVTSNGSVAGNIVNNTALIFANPNTQTYGGIISGGGALTKSGAGTLILTGANSYTGATTLSAGTLQFGNGVNNISLATSSITNNGILAFANPNALSYGGIISGSGAVTISGPGSLTLTNANTYAGNTTITGGTLTVGNSLALQNSTLAYNGGAVNFGNGVTTATFGGLSGDGKFALSNASSQAVALTVGGNNASTTYGGVLSSGGSLTKTGTGTLTLTGANTYTGATTISGGILQLGNGFNSNGAVTGDILNNGILAFANPSAQTFSSLISGSGVVTISGPGILTLSGTNTYSGTTTLSAGTLIVGNALALQNSTLAYNAGQVKFGNGVTSATFGGLSGAGNLILSNPSSQAVALTVGGNNASTTYGGMLSDGAAAGGLLTKTGTGTLILTGANTYTSATTISAGTLQFGNGVNNINLTTSGITDNGTLAFANPNALSFSGLISGSGAVTISGPGALTLTNANTYGGSTTITGGVLTVGNALALQNSTLAYNGGTVNFGSAVTTATFSGLSGSGNLALANSAATPQAVALTVGGNNASTTYSGMISDGNASGGSLTKTGTGTLTLTGANTYTGATTISAGALQLGNGVSNISLSTGSILDNASLVFANPNALSYGGVISGSGAVTKSGAGTLTLTGANAYTGATTISGGTLQFGDGVNNVSLATGNITDNASLVFANPNALSYSGVISGGGAVTLSGPGALTLSGANTYSGNTTVTASTLTIGNSLALQNSTLAYNGGTVNFASGVTAATLGSLSGSGNLALANSAATPQAAALTVGGNNASTTYSGILSDGTATGGSLTKTGAGTLTLASANTYTGTTTLSAGTLSLNDPLALQNSTLAFNSGSLLFGNGITSATLGGLSGSGTIGLINTNPSPGAVALTVGGNNASTTYSGVIQYGSTLTKTGTGTLILTNANTYFGSGGTTISGGTLQLGDGTTNGSVAGNITDNATLVFANKTAQTFSNAIGGSGAVTVSGPGTLTLSGQNGFRGNTTIGAGGSLMVGNSVALQSSTLAYNTGSVKFGSTITSATFGGLSGSANLALLNTATTPKAVGLSVGGNNDSTTYSGILSSGTLTTGIVTKTGTGTLTLAGANTFSGSFTLSIGGLTIANSQALQYSTVGVSLNANGNKLSFDSSITSATFGNLTGLGNVALVNNAATPQPVALTVNDSNTPQTSFTGVLSGTGSFTKMGSGAFRLAGANTFTGTTTVSAGTLTIGNTLALQNSTLSYNAGAVGFGTTITAATLGGLSGSVNLALTNTATTPAAVALTVGNNNASTAFSGAISDGTAPGGALTKIGTGALTLSGASTYTGGTTINAGTVVASGGTTSGGTLVSGGLGKGAVTVASGATLSVGQAPNTTNNALAGVQSLSVSSLSVASNSGNATPLLTFNLFPDGTSDSLTLTGSGTSLTFSGAGQFVIGFASGTGSTLSNLPYTLMTFTSPGANDTSGLDTTNANNSFKAVGTGNLARTSGSFQWTKDNSTGYITGLQYVVSSTDATPEPTALILLLPGGLGLICLRLRRRQ